MIALQKTHSKVKNIDYDKFVVQPYLTDVRFQTKEKQMLFSLRVRMTSTKLNYRSMYTDLNCNICSENVPQSDSHLLECQTLINECSELRNDTQVEYEDIFGNTEEQLRIAKLFMAIFETKSDIESIMPV